MDADKEKLLARMRAIVEKHLDGVVTFEQGHALIDDLTALFAAPLPAQLDKTHYQCERCGGMGQQPAGVYRMGTKKYDAPAGTCELCDGTGYLGPYTPSPAQAVGGEYEWPAHAGVWMWNGRMPALFTREPYSFEYDGRAMNKAGCPIYLYHRGHELHDPNFIGHWLPCDVTPRPRPAYQERRTRWER
jgi:hypothetical protein